MSRYIQLHVSESLEEVITEVQSPDLSVEDGGFEDDFSLLWFPRLLPRLSFSSRLLEAREISSMVISRLKWSSRRLLKNARLRRCSAERHVELVSTSHLMRLY